jgi:hypothetical protein
MTDEIFILLIDNKPVMVSEDPSKFSKELREQNNAKIIIGEVLPELPGIRGIVLEYKNQLSLKELKDLQSVSNL